MGILWPQVAYSNHGSMIVAIAKATQTRSQEKLCGKDQVGLGWNVGLDHFLLVPQLLQM